MIEVNRALVASFMDLTKFRLNLLVLITTVIGYFLASPNEFQVLRLFHCLIGTAVLGMTASAINQFMEIERDRKMNRTKNRPLVQNPQNGLKVFFAATLVNIVGTIYLWMLVNPLTAFLGLLSSISYVALYTPLKPKSHLNTLVGAIPGALPPVMGWAAAMGNLTVGALVLFGILFFWQVPHFLAIAQIYQKDFEMGGFKMLPSMDVDGQATARQILFYTSALLPMSLLPTFLGLLGKLYFWGAFIFGVIFIFYSIKAFEKNEHRHNRKLFLYSIIYLPALLILMIVDKLEIF